jgi:hypothetical protein
LRLIVFVATLPALAACQKTEGEKAPDQKAATNIPPLAVDQARGVVAQEQAWLDEARRDVARLKPLYAENAVR